MTDYMRPEDNYEDEYMTAEEWEIFTAARKQAAKERKKLAEKQTWKQPVPAMPSEDMMQQWADHFLGLRNDERVGHWRNAKTMWKPEPGSFDKESGLMVLNNAKWDLYLMRSENFTAAKLQERLVKHPFVNNCEYKLDKPEGQFHYNNGVKSWHAADHESANDVGMRTNSNVSMMAGYTKNNDGPAVGGVGGARGPWMTLERKSKRPPGGRTPAHAGSC